MTAGSWTALPPTCWPLKATAMWNGSKAIIRTMKPTRNAGSASMRINRTASNTRDLRGLKVAPICAARGQARYRTSSPASGFAARGRKLVADDEAIKRALVTAELFRQVAEMGDQGM